MRLDGDTYDATRLALRCLYPGLAVGGYLVVDDYGSFDGCRRAVDEFRAEHGIDEPLEQVDRDGRALAADRATARVERSDRRLADGGASGARRARCGRRADARELALDASASRRVEEQPRASAVARIAPWRAARMAPGEEAGR